MTGARALVRPISLLAFLGLAIVGFLAALSIVPVPVGAASSKLTWFFWTMLLSGSVGVALAWRRAPIAAWLVTLLFLSGGSQLWLSDASWFKTMQVQNLGAMGRLAFAVIFVQGAVSLAVLLLDADRWLLRTLRVASLRQSIRLAALFAGLLVFSVSIMSFIGSADMTGYFVQLALGACALAATVTGLLAILFASDLDQTTVPNAWIRAIDRHAFAILPAVFFVIAVLFSKFAFGLAPVVEDETAYLFQARTLAGGAFHAPALPEGVAEQMQFYLITNDGDGWYATTVPGWPLVLALGVLIGLPWLLNPVLGAISIWLGMTFWRRVTTRDQALIVGVLMAASPWLLEASASLMTHALVLALTLGGWCLTAQAKDRPRANWRTVSGLVFIAGLMMGWIFLTRAVEGVLIGGLTGFWILWFFGKQRRILPVLSYGFGCLITGSLYFLYNLHMTGDPLSTPLMVFLNESWGEGANAFGFNPNIGPPGGWSTLDLWPGHSMTEAAVNLNNGLNALNTELFGWSIGSLALLLIYLIWQRPRGAYLAMLILAAVVIVIHLFYWFTGTFYIGPRYWFGAFFAFVALSAGGFDAVRRLLPTSDRAPARPQWHLLLVLMCGFSILVFSTWRGAERYVPRTKHARVMANFQLPDVAAANSIIVLPCQRLFDGAMHRNDPFLSNDAPIFVMATDAEGLAALRSAFPDRSIFDASDMQSKCAR